MRDDNLLSHLRDLEIALHQPKVRSDARRLEELLHDSFLEIGRSGRRYSKADLLRELPSEQVSGEAWSQEFSVAEIGAGVALLTYKSAYVAMDGKMSRYTLRSSIWQRTESGWRMRFHQGTPTEAFAKDMTRINYRH